MKLDTKDFRVREGDEVNLKKWPTKVDPVYKSKEQYQKLLEEHVAQLSSRTIPGFSVPCGSWQLKQVTPRACYAPTSLLVRSEYGSFHASVSMFS